jgi:galactose mutarotase-like enzyme
MSQNSFDAVVIQNENARVGVNSQGGYVTSWQVRNSVGAFEDILYVGSVMKRGGIPVLFPYFGRSEKLRAHGFGRDSKWQIVEQSQNSLQMRLISDALSEDAKVEYPYAFVAEIVVALGEDSSLQYTLSVENTDSQALPISPGLHPYWALAHADKSRLRIDGISGFDAGSIDWNSAPPDTVYSFKDKATVYFPTKRLVIQDVSDVIKYLIVWSQTPQNADYNFVCVEPSSGEHYGIDRAPIMVAAGETWTLSLVFRVEW